ncbi:MAG TPA: tRNA (adenosine(37)-N6)-threonylcarbamoyltransferase complex ATPase subunit type 1 TsaE [Candidatus Avilachnospira avistercoris]|nr:tRNA (adenosine(37)-N6)-threonylcarbamoyltransferase complex ATPase subunit type 1 TsaE [Candidatus Avilachnospira avistercoris]
MIMESHSPKETMELGERLGREARCGDIFLLSGDLGCGKTVFAKGFAKGLGIDEDITSPTFTILREYEGGRLRLAHFDAYRIEDADEMYEIGFEDYLYGDGVCLIEWPEMVEELIPDSAKLIRITKDLSKGEDHRLIEISPCHRGIG